ncbi:DUF1932 domain-containing protein [Roseibium sp.]|uniref:NAD(P)-dependent oxidoreductase n=1 Tax=Roseibium sp. TaxID=1936156 RepID=UPI003A96E7B1
MSTEKPVIGLLGIGEMGGNMARELTGAGFRVVSVLAGRSKESVARAKEAGIEDVADLNGLVAACDILFSVLPPSAAEEEARAVADCLSDAPKPLVFVEGNAISPVLVREIADLFDGTPVTFIDGGIIGQPPKDGKVPRLYLSGTGSEMLDVLDGPAFEIVHLGDTIGDASGFKMVYASQTKGHNALLTAGFVAAERMGLLEAFVAELKRSQPGFLTKAETNIPRLPADAGRWVREMEEIRDTYEALGLTGGFHEGAAAMMRLLANSPFGHETRRTRDTSRGMIETVKALAPQAANENTRLKS